MRLAVVQTNVVFSNPTANVTRLENELLTLAERRVDLAVFPEAFLTGYCAGSQEETRQMAIPLAGHEHEVWRRIETAVNRTRIGVVVGYAASAGPQLLNAATMWLPDGAPMNYAKSHLPILGLDRYVSPGRELPVFDTPWGKVGIMICYDLRIPETARVLALKGAELILVPTNWPGTSQAANYYTVVRSSENKVFLASCDRVGEEGEFGFIGLSGVYGPDGRCIAKAGEGEEVLIADIDLAEARNKRNVYRPGEYELDLWGCRQPDLYGVIAAQRILQ